MSDERSPSARDRVRECDETLGVIAERLAEAEAELAAMSLRDPKRHTLRRRIAEMKADAEDAQAQKAKLAPAVEAERAAEMHRAHVAQWERGAQAYPALMQAAASLDRDIARIIPRMRALYAQAQAVLAAAGVNVPPEHLAQPLPPFEAFTDILTGKAMLAGGCFSEELPARFRDELQPAQAVAAASVAGEFARMAEFINAAHPDRQRMERQRAQAEQRERAEREAAALRDPLPRLPAPPPRVFGSRRDAA